MSTNRCVSVALSVVQAEVSGLIINNSHTVYTVKGFSWYMVSVTTLTIRVHPESEGGPGMMTDR